MEELELGWFAWYSLIKENRLKTPLEFPLGDTFRFRNNHNGDKVIGLIYDKEEKRITNEYKIMLIK